MINEGWQLFDMPGRARANKALNTAAHKAVLKGLKSVLKVGHKQAGQTARMEIARVQEKYSDLGACDSEGNQVACEIIQEYFPGAMEDRWDYDFMSL